jgi:hypothetical protein
MVTAPSFQVKFLKESLLLQRWVFHNFPLLHQHTSLSSEDLSHEINTRPQHSRPLQAPSIAKAAYTKCITQL